ncbi:hypothetical protein JHK85_025710 [Glycine max]|nr:hypothetical protein JHK85_025710 [Glycine max]
MGGLHSETEGFRLIFKPLVDEFPTFGAVCFSLKEKERRNREKRSSELSTAQSFHRETIGDIEILGGIENQLAESSSHDVHSNYDGHLQSLYMKGDMCPYLDLESEKKKMKFPSTLESVEGREAEGKLVEKRQRRSKRIGKDKSDRISELPDSKQKLGRSRRVRKDEKDRLCQLPNCVLLHMMQFTDTKDVV